MPWNKEKDSSVKPPWHLCFNEKPSKCFHGSKLIRRGIDDFKGMFDNPESNESVKLPWFMFFNE
jgi:hypothetical protein